MIALKLKLVLGFWILAIALVLASSTHADLRPSKPSTVTSVRGGFTASYSAGAGRHLAPPAGSNYQKDLRLPFLGRQMFRVSISDRSTGSSMGHLKIEGLMAVDEDINYDICKESGSVMFYLPAGVQKMLRRYRTKLLRANYNPDKDTIIVEVRAPLAHPIRIEMLRIS